MDAEQRKNLRAARFSGEVGALIRWANAGWRVGGEECSRVLEELVAQAQRGVDPAAHHACALLASLSPSARRTHIETLTTLVNLGEEWAVELLRASVPSLQRIRCERREELERFVCAAARRDEPVRLVSSSNEDQALVAACIHDLRGGVGFLANHNFVCPSEERRTVEYWSEGCHWSTVFVYGLSESHFSRLEEQLTPLCAEASTLVIYGVRLDAWDGDAFGAFSGLDLELPMLELAPYASGEVLVSELLFESLRVAVPLSPSLRLRFRGLDMQRAVYRSAWAVRSHRRDGVPLADALAEAFRSDRPRPPGIP